MYKLITRVPLSHAEKVREALSDAGAGKYPHYSKCSFTVKGIGRFLGDENSNPRVGIRGVLEEVEEEQISVIVQEENIKEVIDALKKAHPYEEIPIEVVKLENMYDFK